MYKVCTNCATVQEQCIFIRFDTIINAQLLQVQEKVFVGVVAFKCMFVLLPVTYICLMLGSLFWFSTEIKTK